jgi:tagatose 6-phosphate kinase
MVFRRLVVDSVNRAASTFDGSAGKSVNVAKVLSALGAQAVAVGFFGGDRGEEIGADLKARGIELDFVTVAERTRQCVTLIDESASAVTELVEESRPVPGSAYGQLLEIIYSWMDRCRAVVMSGTLTPGGPTDFYRRCIERSHQIGVLSVVDAQGPVLIEALKAGPGLVKPNRAELAATAGRALLDEAAVLGAMRELHGNGAQRVVVTAGKDPILASDGQAIWRIHPARIHPVNPIGSGDAFTAALTWRLLCGDDLGAACRWAVAAGGANALTALAGEVDPQEVKRLIDETVAERL